MIFKIRNIFLLIIKMNSNNDNLMDNIKSDLYEICINIKNSLNKSDLDKLINGTNEDISNSSSVPILINYLRSHINFIIKEKIIKEDINNGFSYIESIRQMESYIQKLENDIKYHLKRHFENKILKDSLQLKVRAYVQMEEDYEELRQKVRYEDGKFLENDRKDNEILILRRENSNIKKDITKFNKKLEKHQELEEKYNELEEKNDKLNEKYNELEGKYNDLEKVHINDEENIKNLNLKIEQLNIRITELNENLKNSNLNSNNSNRIKLKNNKEIIKINDFNNFSIINYKQPRTNLDKLKINSTSKLSKYKNANNINKNGLNFFSNESKHFKSRTTKTMDANIYNNPVIKSNTFNQDKFTNIKNNNLKKDKKKMSYSKSLISEKYENSDIINKLIRSKSKNKNSRARGFKIIDKIFSDYKFHFSNINLQKGNSKNKNIIYEHSALNILGIPKNYKK